MTENLAVTLLICSLSTLLFIMALAATALMIN